MATAVPVLRILNPQAPGDRQQAVAVPSKEARLYRDRERLFPHLRCELLSEATAMAKAEKLLRAKATRAIAGPSTRPIVHAIAGRPILPATSTIARPVPSLFPGPILPASNPVCQCVCPPYNRVHSLILGKVHTIQAQGVDEPSGVGAKVSRVQKLPSCTCCGQPTQGHKKYRRKVFCPVKMMSPSKGLEKNTVYNSYQHFTAVVDALEQ
ncbi:DNA polymerase zeta catalytic subunit [Dissostichus eleginoides]|uniref:DNA polymerase zeta catalytic subunit n=1 Tax=Dissostichus eleginoides TaxID=100907 RepID=A0AAD9F4D6_DISEL|nr:DNA polymerase zeta catalytic subunit [Dissostichus eleginoides]